ncbi:MAG: arylsulfatase [Parvibaculales bacterium]
MSVQFIRLCVFVIMVTALFPVGQGGAQPQSQPNIVILLADDLGYADLGFRGSDIETPHLDQMAADGMRLERFYSLPICTPTRSALMTARDPVKLGMAYAGLQPWVTGGVSPQERFMPESFRDAGYDTAMVGKWHLGRAHEALVPHSRGFNHFIGHLNTQVDYYTHSATGGHDLQENGTSVYREGQYATDIHGDEAAKFITSGRDKSKPFFLYVPFLAPHSPMQAPEELEDKYSDRSNLIFPKRTYAAMVDSMDQNIGKIFAALEAEGVADNTIVFFFSDNGGFAGFGADNTPYRGGKLETFEGGIRVNALIKWPAVIAPGSETDQTISVMDIFPTFAAAAGIEMGVEKKLDGLNRLPVLEGKNRRRPGALFFGSNSPEYNLFNLAVVEGDMKLVQIVDHDGLETNVENYLFDLNADPQEQNNLAEEKAYLVRQMSKKLRNWQAQHPVSGIRVSINPHPGWRAPKDFAEDIRSSEGTLSEEWGGFGTLATKTLQLRYGDKGRIKYE